MKNQNYQGYFQGSLWSIVVGLSSVPDPWVKVVFPFCSPQEIFFFHFGSLKPPLSAKQALIWGVLISKLSFEVLLMSALQLFTLLGKP